MKTSQNIAMAIILVLNSVNSYSGDWQIGMAMEDARSGVLDAGNETELAPVINYQGERVSYIGGMLKYGLKESDSYHIDLIGQPRAGVYEPDDSPRLKGMEERDSGFDLGLNLGTKHAWGSLGLELLNDASDTDQGHEIKASYSVPKQFGRWLLEPVFGLQWQSEGRVLIAWSILVSRL